MKRHKKQGFVLFLKNKFLEKDFLGLKMGVSFNFVLSKINYLWVAAIIITELESSDMIKDFGLLTKFFFLIFVFP